MPNTMMNPTTLTILMIRNGVVTKQGDTTMIQKTQMKMTRMSMEVGITELQTQTGIMTLIAVAMVKDAEKTRKAVEKDKEVSQTRQKVHQGVMVTWT